MTKQVEFWVIGVIVVLLGIMSYSFMQEHDARLRAEAIVKTAKANTAAIETQTKVKVTAIKKKAAAVKTPAAAIAAIPEVSDVPLNPRPLPSLPDAVVVQAVPLYQELAQCRITEAKLSGCEAVAVEKDKEIKALTKKPSFWARVKRNAEIVGAIAGAGAIGYAAHR